MWSDWLQRGKTLFLGLFSVQSSCKLIGSGVSGISDLRHGVWKPQVGEVTRLGGVTRLSIYSLILIWSRLHDRWGDHMRDYKDTQVAPSKRVISPTFM